MQEPQVILVDQYDQEIGAMGKLQAHVEGKLHRAFSIFLFNENGDLILQQRALSKYHSGGLWTNTCCSHPAPGEFIEDAVQRRLQEELGINAPVDRVGEVLYKAKFGNGLTEHEYDYVFVGQYSGSFAPNAEEVEQLKFISINDLEKWLEDQPEDFTAWFPLCLDIVKRNLETKAIA
ncbi:isopentenyl-diphosphate Delta-isomerase [Flammeovirga agarivorans]|uniref:Isopentenyl-diphosphate delta-isomerase n=1 Tax=Flammeovirga agarivorans TaxID=2726742 RepID=A0A7X8XUZ3_9BACT|nr:isopentenyl-diphosphate Delta-isomerase [Flammeovirga agarivorans]NLR90575.1 isopentenyl-diphosphate Delta-isomerase [Flammeovirga agarivorans]